MSDDTTISAEQRERVGKGSARAVRRAGRVPAVIYGDKKEPISITLESREITKIVNQPGVFGKLLDITEDRFDTRNRSQRAQRDADVVRTRREHCLAIAFGEGVGQSNQQRVNGDHENRSAQQASL